jgi:prepilin-type N-terminal cleavage/methylation domain-containing protein
VRSHLPRRGACAGPSVRAGFTLVELMVVIIILGLVGGVAVTSWSKMLPGQQFNSAVRELSEVLHGTRSDAIARNREFRIVYDLDDESYKVRTPFRMGGGFTDEDADPERLWIHETDLAKHGIEIVNVVVDDVTFTDGIVEVIFKPLGASSHHIVHIAQPALEREYTIEALPLTGEIRLHEGQFSRKPVDESDFR